ncbi:MAG: tetratricopeptide repeat protein [Pyrinomonadaceae bacterium]
MLDQLSTSNTNCQRLALTLCLAFAAPSAIHSQTKSAPAPASQTAAPEKTGQASSETTTTRARRVGTQPAGEAQSVGEVKHTDASKGAADDEPWVKPGAAAPKVEPAEAELQRRRAEIKDAPPEGRARLQRELIGRLVELNRKDEALSELRLMIHEDRYDPTFFYNTGNALARLGDANAAADAYRKAVSQRKGNYARALNNLGVVLTRQGLWDEAFDALVAALTQENFTYAEASYNLGRLYLLRGDANLAIREWGRTLRLQPDHAAAAAALARAYAEDGNAKHGLAVLENFTSRAAQTGGGVPREISFAREEINSGVEGEDAWKERREDATVDGATSNGSGAATNNMARASVAPRNPASRASLARSLSVDPQTYTMLQSARDASDGGKFDEAVRRYRGVLSRSGGYLPPANLELSFALINLHRIDEAVASLSTVAARDGARYPVAYYHLARLYERQGQLDLAARNFALAAEHYGDNAPQMLSDLSRVREKLNDTPGALAAMESYVKAISQQGSVPDWATERLNSLREKAKGTTATQANATAKP